MIDPVTPAAQVPWRGKTYGLHLTLGSLAEASGCKGIPPILEGGPDSMFSKPEFYQRGVLLFALIRQQFPDVTLSECMEAVTGPKAEYYGKILAEAIRELAPAIARLHGAEVKDEPPLADASSGASSGPALVTTSESPARSSGRSRRGN